MNSVANNVPLLLETTSCLTDSGVLLGRCLTTSTNPIALLLNHTDGNITIPVCKRLVTGTSVREVYPSTTTSVNKISPTVPNLDVTFTDFMVWFPCQRSPKKNVHLSPKFYTNFRIYSYCPDAILVVQTQCNMKSTLILKYHQFGYASDAYLLNNKISSPTRHKK